jgi:hypothetical protein
MAEVFELINDIALSYDGDLMFDDTQDLKLISGIDWFKREVNKIIRTKLREWRSEPGIGLNLDEFTGRQNTKQTANELQSKLLDALTLDNFQFPGQFDVKIIPVSNSDITIYITYNIIGQVYQISKLIYSLDRGISQHINDEFKLTPERTIPKQKKEENNFYLKALSQR